MNEQKKRQPWMKFYPADWQADDGLRQCGLAARGLWIDMISIMHKSEVYGHLLIAGVNPTEQQIASACRADVKAVKSAIAELESWKVFSRTDEGVIFSRRMVSDALKQERDSENGRGGGNPQLKPAVNPKPNLSVIQGVNPPDKAQMLDARSQKLEEEKEPPSLRSVPQNRGTRLPDDWAPSAEEADFAADLRLNPNAVAAKFRDYWHGKPGTAGRKSDWTATWRNWCRSDAERRKPEREDPMVAVARTMGLFNPEPEDFTPDTRMLRYDA